MLRSQLRIRLVLLRQIQRLPANEWRKGPEHDESLAYLVGDFAGGAGMSIAREVRERHGNLLVVVHVRVFGATRRHHNRADALRMAEVARQGSQKLVIVHFCRADSLGAVMCVGRARTVRLSSHR